MANGRVDNMVFRSVDFTRIFTRFDAAINGLAAIGLAQPRDPNRLDVSNLPRPDMLARLLSEIASVWRRQRGELADRMDAVRDIDSPEALVSFAAANEIDVVFENRLVASLSIEDLPAVMLTNDGMGRMLVARRGRNFIAHHAGKSYVIDKDALAREEAGTIFLVRPRSLAPGGNLAELVSEVAGPEPSDPVRGILKFMTARHRKLMVQLLIAAAFSNMMLLALPIYSGLIFDRVIPHSAFDTLWAISIGVTMALLADIAVRWVRLKIQDALASAASSAVQASVMRKLLEAKMTEAPRSAGAIALRLRNLDGMTQLIPQLVTGVFVDVPFLLLVFSLLWLDGGPVVLAPILGVVALYGVHHWTNIGSEAEQLRSTALMQLQSNRLNEAVEVLEMIKATRTEPRILNRFERIFDEFAYCSHVARLWQGVAAYANATVGQLMIALVLVIGAYEISYGNMTVGGLSACSLLVGRIIGPIGQLISVIHRMIQSRAMLRSLADESRYESEVAGDDSGALGAPIRCSLRLNNVSFAYASQGAAQIDGLSAHIRPGERVAIVGRSGSGKSTLLRLIARLAEPDRGSVLLDDFDVRQYAPYELRKALGYMGQVPGLVDDTLMKNLTFGLDKLDPEQFGLMMRLTGVADFAAAHPSGFAMNVGPRGERLSGGERQSVALGRLLLANPSVLLLDEPTSSMDTMLEARLVKNLADVIGDRTFIVATHRAPVLQLVDRIIWLESGRLVADGPKAEVFKRMSGAAA
jgi:ATP-binding cassette, subfamily C, bacterial LapB